MVEPVGSQHVVGLAKHEVPHEMWLLEAEDTVVEHQLAERLAPVAEAEARAVAAHQQCRVAIELVGLLARRAGEQTHGERGVGSGISADTANPYSHEEQCQ